MCWSGDKTSPRSQMGMAFQRPVHLIALSAPDKHQRVNNLPVAVRQLLECHHGTQQRAERLSASSSDQWDVPAMKQCGDGQTCLYILLASLSALTFRKEVCVHASQISAFSHCYMNGNDVPLAFASFIFHASLSGRTYWMIERALDTVSVITMVLQSRSNPWKLKSLKDQSKCHKRSRQQRKNEKMM